LGQRQCWIARVELLLASHEPEQALQVIDVLAEAIPHPATAPDPAPILKLRGDALAQLHDQAGAERAYLAARQSAALYGFLPILWKIDEAHGQLLTAQGRTAEAQAAFQRARATIAEMAGTIPDETIREAFIARALHRLPPVAPDEDDRANTVLSPREFEVLRLIVEGQSDREIAAALSISHRTVMRHVTGILTKLDVSSRTAAATLAVRQNLVG
jgi:DNA-binding CsgD family transcriptional regulator